MPKAGHSARVPSNSTVRIPSSLLNDLSLAVHYQAQVQNVVEPRASDSEVQRANRNVQAAMRAVRDCGLKQGIAF